MPDIYYQTKHGGYAKATGREPKGTRYYRQHQSGGYQNISEKYARTKLSGKSASAPKVVKGVARNIPSVKGSSRASSRSAFGNFVRSNGGRYGSIRQKGGVSFAGKGGKSGSGKAGG